MSNELINIIKQGYESKDLDYKGPFAWNEADKKTCCDVVRDILAMANTLGGYIVIGVSEVPTGYQWDGLSTEQADTFDTTRLNRFLQNYADPPINALLKKIPHDGKVFVVIEIPRFTDTPHLCQRDYPDVLKSPALYVRTDNNETALVRSSADFRAVVEQAVRNRSDALLTSFRSILKGGVPTGKSDSEQCEEQWQNAIERFDNLNPLKKKGYTGYREVAFSPAQFQADRFTREQLREAAEHACVNYTGWPFLLYSPRRNDMTYAVQGGIETLLDHSDNDDRVDFWQFLQSGFFYQRTLMWEEFYQRQRNASPALHIDSLVQYTGQAVDALIKLYEKLLSETEVVELKLRVLGTERRSIETFDLRRLYGSYVCRIPIVEVCRAMSLAEWRAAVVDHSADIATAVFHQFNWEHAGGFHPILEKMFSRRY